MNMFLKKILLGLIIWVIPFVSSFFVWDIEANAPWVGMQWFNALMAFTWSVGFAIAAYCYFKDAPKDDASDGWKTGILWYIELAVLDFIVLVNIFGMTMGEYYPMLVTYLNVLVVSAAIGYLRK